ncbi:MAG: RagB/SusD family nutrient uptake outer membrane protein, partial [Bacteroidales bacterium]
MGFALLTSCNVMDTQPFESYDEDLVWGSKSTIDAFIFETYNNSVALYAGGFPGGEGWTPNGIKSDLSNTDNFPLERIDRYYDSGFNRFGALRRCNMIIEKGGASEGLSEIQKKEVVAEGHMLRGLIFYNQTQRMGRFILIKKVLSPSDSMDFKTPLTKDLAESYTLVMSDFDKAIEGLPEVSASGRVNKFAALAYKSEAALQAYAYTKDTKYLDMAIEASTQIIESGKYQIDENYGDMFLAPGKFSPEIILGYYRLDQNTSFVSFQELINVVPNIKNDEVKGVQGSPLFKNANGMTFEGWATYFPTQEMVDQYLTIDEATGEAKSWDQTSQFKKSVQDDLVNLTLGCYTTIATNVPSEEDLSGVNAKGPILNKAGKVIDNANISELMYNNRDKRFYSTIV